MKILKYYLVEACLKYLHLEERIAHRKVKVQLSPVSIRPIDLTVKNIAPDVCNFTWQGEEK